MRAGRLGAQPPSGVGRGRGGVGQPQCEYKRRCRQAVGRARARRSADTGARALDVRGRGDGQRPEEERWTLDGRWEARAAARGGSGRAITTREPDNAKTSTPNAEREGKAPGKHRRPTTRQAPAGRGDEKKPPKKKKESS